MLKGVAHIGGVVAYGKYWKFVQLSSSWKKLQELN